MKNNERCFAYFKRGCEDGYCAAPRVETTLMRFGDILECGTPLCPECGAEMIFSGVEIIPVKTSKKKQ